MLIPPLSEVLFLFVTNDRSIPALVFSGDARENKDITFNWEDLSNLRFPYGRVSSQTWFQYHGTAGIRLTTMFVANGVPRT